MYAWVCGRFAARLRVHCRASAQDDSDNAPEDGLEHEAAPGDRERPRRLRVRQHDVLGSRDLHVNSIIPGFPWEAPGWRRLQRLLSDAGMDAEQLACDVEKRGAIVGLVEIESVTAWDGALFQFTDEERFLFEYNARQPMSFVRVRRAICLQEPVMANHFSAAAAPRSTVFRLVPDHVEMLLGLATTSGQTVAQAFEAWSPQARANLDSCVQVWLPIAVAVCHSNWRTLSLNASTRPEHCELYHQLQVHGRVRPARS